MLLDVRRGILGGTFDPPHLAHLVAAEAAYRQLGLDVVVFIPAGEPWQKLGSGVSAGPHRLAMTELAVADVAYFQADDREVVRTGWSYTIDTLETFPADDDLTVILGADAALGLATWHRAEELLDSARFAVVPRHGIDRNDVDEVLAGVAVRWLDMPELDISSTALRERLLQSRSVRFLVPAAVLRYINDHGLYREV